MKGSLIAAGVFSACAIVWAQGVPAQSPQQAPPQFRSTIDLVHMDVSVLDKNRRPVRGLSQSDFTVLENGKPQQIAAFSAVSVPDPVAPSAPWIRDVPPDVRNNADVRERRLFVIAIDDATIENNVFAVKSVKDIGRRVVEKLGPADLAAVVFTRDNRHSQDFTSDHARLLDAVNSFTPGSRGMTSDVPVGNIDDLWYMYSVGMLERAVDYLTDLPDRRKAIIYVGQGLPFDVETAASPVNAVPPKDLNDPLIGKVSNSALQMRIKDQMNDLFERAVKSNVNVYTVDACGLRVPQQAAGSGAKPTCQPGLEVSYLTNVAESTGGRPVVNSSDFGPGLDAVFAENASYYLLGYQSTDPTKDGKFRKLEVQVNRPGLTIRTRTGYDAPREVAVDKPRAAASPLGQAFAGVLPKSDLPMQITAAAFAPIKSKADPTVVIAVGFRQPIRETAEATIEQVDLQVAAFNSDGRSFGNTRGQADVKLRPGATGPAEYEVFTRIDLKPGRYQLRIAANVGSLSTTGSVFYDVDVPDFAEAPLSMSGLLVSAQPSPVFAPKDALKDVVPVIPTTRRQFSPAHTVAVFARVYQGGSKKQLPVTARLRIRNATDVTVKELTQEIAAGQFGGTSRSADVRFDVPVKDLQAGAYVVTIETTAGTASVHRDSRFQVVR